MAEADGRAAGPRHVHADEPAAAFGASARPPVSPCHPTMSLGMAMTVFAVVADPVFVLTAYALPETRGRELEP